MADSSRQREIGALVSYADTFVAMVVGLLYVPLLLRTIGQAEYGLYQLIGSIIAYLNIISSMLAAGVTRYYCKFFALGDTEGMAKTLGISKKIYSIANVVVVIAATILIFMVRTIYAASLSAWELNESSVIIGLLAFNLMLTMNNTLSIAVITAHEHFVFLKLSNLTLTALQPITVLIVVQAMPYAVAVSAAQVALNALLRFVQRSYAIKKLGMDTSIREYDRDLERELMRFSGNIVLSTIADQIFWKTDQLILGYLYGTSIVAIYSVGMTINTIYLSLGMAVSSVFMPQVSELWHKDKNIHAISDLFIRVARIALYPLLLVLLGFIVFGKEFISLWAGPNYVEAYLIAIVVMVPFTVDLMQNIGLTILQVINKYGFRSIIYLTAATLNIILTLVLAQHFGGIGAAISSSIAIIISSGIILNWYYQTKIHLNMRDFWSSIIHETAPLIIYASIMFFAWSQYKATIQDIGWIPLILGILLFSFGFLVVAYLFSFNSSEKNLIAHLIHFSKK